MDQEQEMEEEERIRMPNTTPGSRNLVWWQRTNFHKLPGRLDAS